MPVSSAPDSNPPDGHEAFHAARDTQNPPQTAAEAAAPEEIAPTTDHALAQISLAADVKAEPLEEPTPVLPPTAEATPVEEPTPVPPPAAEVTPVEELTPVPLHTAEATPVEEPTPILPATADATPVEEPATVLSPVVAASDAMQNAPVSQAASPVNAENAQAAIEAAMVPTTEERPDEAAREAVVEEKLASDRAPTQIASAQADAIAAEMPTAPTQETQQIASSEPAPSAFVPSATEASTTEPAPEVAARSDVSGKWVQLGALRDESAAEQSWDRIVRRNDDLLKSVGHAVRRTDLGPDRGVYYRLRAGPFSSIDDARSLCSTLKSRKVACFVVAI